MAYVIIGGFSSTCSACGGNAAPTESAHISGGPDEMWVRGSSLDDKNGCGVEWVEPAVHAYAQRYTPEDVTP